MGQLPQSAFDRAAEYIALNARPLEPAIFQYRLGSGSILDVIVGPGKFWNLSRLRARGRI